ncbi:succinylglutamate-semialdehyde dehydrogenase [Sphingomonas cavernae]|uniref:N-succinylglutamate 5-semialdehyde dehydrogenase n=1 Tax=Sphingomonas cavernae TaxID=2320861 RepID=A0A418W6Y3_9SPHN|nr:succinylglutamate-semialdehyde dehydrogenase [Sphingomonas cavernae]RJF85801.1 succinylglutamate-semialdehyde dehydrogenase [Sphingomonas cavernae]
MTDLYINGHWNGGRGEPFTSLDPATGDQVWHGRAATSEDCASAIAAARAAFQGWADTPLEERIAAVKRFAEQLERRKPAFAEAISRETGKALWETTAEIGAMIGKVGISIAAYAERTGTREAAMDFGRAVLRHRPHGVMVVLGPYNFPGHLPNGHIVPALIAGDTVVFKPSELTPHTGQLMAEAWAAAGLPAGVFNLVQGGRDTGAALIAGNIDGLLFTGSAAAGAHFRRFFADKPHVILALELGGNNPLIAWDGDVEATASIIVQSSFITTGQRCSCARRLIVPEGAHGDAVIEATAAMAQRLRIGAWNDNQEPFMGPLIANAPAAHALEAVKALETRGAKTVLPFRILDRSPAFVTPAILDVTGADTPDTEIFAPILQVARVADFDAAIAAANNTAFGLSAGLITDEDALWCKFLSRARAGVINRNRPTTGAASNMPFGGLGESGNHRPSAYYAADYCAYPVASFEADLAIDQSMTIKGLD